MEPPYEDVGPYWWTIWNHPTKMYVLISGPHGTTLKMYVLISGTIWNHSRMYLLISGPYETTRIGMYSS
jgi:hypothetical protein